MGVQFAHLFQILFTTVGAHDSSWGAMRKSSTCVLCVCAQHLGDVPKAICGKEISWMGRITMRLTLTLKAYWFLPIGLESKVLSISSTRHYFLLSISWGLQSFIGVMCDSFLEQTFKEKSRQSGLPLHLLQYLMTKHAWDSPRLSCKLTGFPSKEFQVLWIIDFTQLFQSLANTPQVSNNAKRLGIREMKWKPWWTECHSRTATSQLAKMARHILSRVHVNTWKNEKQIKLDEYYPM